MPSERFMQALRQGHATRPTANGAELEEWEATLAGYRDALANRGAYYSGPPRLTAAYLAGTRAGNETRASRGVGVA